MLSFMGFFKKVTLSWNVSLKKATLFALMTVIKMPLSAYKIAKIFLNTVNEFAT